MSIDRQTQWMTDLFASMPSCPEGLTTWNGSDPSQRFAVYRNNVIVSLTDALADSFPVVQALVGDDFFVAMAREFIRTHPPSSPVLVWYGAEFPDFIYNFPPASSVPYLADVARLEWMRVAAWHAADTPPMAQEALTAWLANGDALAQTTIELHPSLSTFRSQFPVASLWAAHQHETVNLSHIDLAVSEAVVLMRQNMRVDMTCFDYHTVTFISLLKEGLSFADAVQRAGELELSDTLAWLLKNECIVNVRPMRE